MRAHLPFAAGLALLFGAAGATAGEVRTAPAEIRQQDAITGERLEQDRLLQSDVGDRLGLTVTVYQSGLALVNDRREVGLSDGMNRLVLADISRELLPESLRVTGEGSPRLHGQRYREALLTRERLLQAHVGRQVLLLPRDRANGEPVEARLLSVADGNPVVDLDDRIEVVDGQSSWRIAFDGVPGGLQARPGLVLDLETGLAGRQELDLLYLTRGLAWQADYVISLDGEEMELHALATVDNRSGIPLGDASLRLVAGDPQDAPQVRMERAMADSAVDSQAEGGYQLFRLPDPVSLADDERSQLPLFVAEGLPVERQYRVEGQAWGRRAGEQSQAVSIHLAFDTEEESLNRPLPAGTARVYQADSEGEPLFLGQDRIAATPVGNRVELRVGTAFDITALRSQLEYRRLDESSEEQVWRIRLANAGEEDVTVQVVEQLPGDWTILEASAEHRRPTADRALWELEVPGGGETELQYRVEIRRQ